MNPHRSSHGSRAGGFTLVEALVATTIASLVLAGTMVLFITFLRSYRDTTLLSDTSIEASTGLERMVIGVGANLGLREASAKTVVVSYPSNGWCIALTTNLYFQYSPATKSITDQKGKTIASGVSTSSLTYTTKGIVTNGCMISLTVLESGGGRTSSNVMTTYVQFRN